MKEQLLAYYRDYKEKGNAFSLALATMSFDKSTIAPKDGQAYTNKMMSILATEQFVHYTNEEAYQKIKELSTYDLDETLRKEVDFTLQSLEENKHIPKEVFNRFVSARNDSGSAWQEAKNKSDYEMFKPYLKKVVEAQKEILSYHPNKEMKPYDILLDKFQKGMDEVRYDAFFETIKERLLPFIQKVIKSDIQIDDAILHDNYDTETQAEFMDDILMYLRRDTNKTYMCTTEHPFTSFFSVHDVRLTTHYYENALSSAIYSTIHEYGHALYGLQVNPDYNGSELYSQIGFAMHESQSRFLENHIGKSEAFWKANLPKLQKRFPQFQSIDAKQLTNMLAKSSPSLIRIEADELTYPIHVLIRYELEKEMFNNGEIDYDHLHEEWNAKYQEYLGISATNDKEGILQDVHWSMAYLGYFPTYALGSAYAAQFYNTMQQQLDVESLLANDKFEEIASWLKENIHQYGAAKSADELLQDVTKEAFNPNYYVDYLIEKYSTLYKI